MNGFWQARHGSTSAYSTFTNDNIEPKSIYLVLQSGTNCTSTGTKANILSFAPSCACNGYRVAILEEVPLLAILQHHGLFPVLRSLNEATNCVGSSARNSTAPE